MSFLFLYLCYFKLPEGNVRVKDQYLTKILLVAAKKSITRKWGKVNPPTQEQWLETVEEIFIMEKMTHRLRLQETQMDDKWEKWTLFRTKSSDIRK